MNTSSASTHGGSLTYESHPEALLGVQKLAPTLPTFLTEALLSGSGAGVCLFEHDWFGALTNGRFFLWRYQQSKVAPPSSCRQFALPKGTDSINLVALSFDADRPTVCACVGASESVLRLWSGGLPTAGGLLSTHDFTDTKINGLKYGESIVAIDKGLSPGTFLMATSSGRIFGVDARTHQDRVCIFFITSNEDAPAGGANTSLNASQSMSEMAANASVLSGLTRRVSSIWSYAANRVVSGVVGGCGVGGAGGSGTSPSGKVLRFLVEAESTDDTCRLYLLSQGRLCLWHMDSEFEYTVIYSLVLNNSSYGQAVDMCLSPPSTLFVLCKSADPIEVVTSSSLALFSVDVGRRTAISPSKPVSLQIDEDMLDTESAYRLIVPMSGTRVYPCQLVGVLSQKTGVTSIVEALSGRCVAVLGLGDPPALIGVTSAPEVAASACGALFGFVTRQRGIYAIAGEDACLPHLSHGISSLLKCKQLDADQTFELLSRTAAILWMGYKDESDRLVHKLLARLPSTAASANLVAAFLRLVRRVLDSRPSAGPDGRWRALAAATATEFDFARVGSSRFIAKQRGMQKLGQELWRHIALSLPHRRDITSGSLASLMLSNQLAASTSKDEEQKTEGAHHILNAFMLGAELCECARVLHEKLSRGPQSPLMKQLFQATIQDSDGIPEQCFQHLLQSDDILFQTVSLMPKFIAKLSEQLVNVIGQMSADGEVTAAVEHTTFVTLAAPLVTLSLSETLNYRAKLLPALETAVTNDETSADGYGYDFFCWISSNNTTLHLLELFDSLVGFVQGNTNGVAGDAVLHQQCICQAVELATILLRAGSHRVNWLSSRRSRRTPNAISPSTSSSSVGQWFDDLRCRLIAAVAWKLGRSEAALDLAERFGDKEHIVSICDHLDRQRTAGGEFLGHHTHLMASMARVPVDLQLGDFALQWHYTNGEKARVQSLLAALQDKAAGEESGDGLPGVSDKKRPFPSPPLLPQPSSMMTGAVVSKRARCTTATVGATPKAYSSSVNRFLERREAGDFAWLHQLGSEEYDKASKGLFASGLVEQGAIGRRRTLLSLAKLSAIAGGGLPAPHAEFATATSIDKSATFLESATTATALSNIDTIDQHLEVIGLQADLEAGWSTVRGDNVEGKSETATNSTGDAVCLAPCQSPASLARLYVQQAAALSSAIDKENRPAGSALTALARAIRLAQLSSMTTLDRHAQKQTLAQLLNYIWSQTMCLDGWEKPGDDADLDRICDRSLFALLLENCLRSGHHVEAVFPPLDEFLDFLNAQENGGPCQQWRRLLVEHCYNRTLSAIYNDVPMEL